MLCRYELEMKSGDWFVPKAEKKQPSQHTKTETVLPEPEELEMVSSDGLILKADLYPFPSHRYAVSAHGYRGSRNDMRSYASVFHSWGCNVLLPDSRAHGGSEGGFTTMGLKEKDDLISWINLIIGRDPEAVIFLHGVSMGGTTVMLCSGEDLPDNVKAVIEDCGYSSVWDINKDELKAVAHLPAFPILYLTDLFFRLYTGKSGKDVSAKDAVARSTVPVLFIHGESDNFIRPSMMEECYQAKTEGLKEQLYVPGAKHAGSSKTDPDLYFTTIKEFLDLAGF